MTSAEQQERGCPLLAHAVGELPALRVLACVEMSRIRFTRCDTNLGILCLPPTRHLALLASSDHADRRMPIWGALILDTDGTAAECPTKAHYTMFDRPSTHILESRLTIIESRGAQHVGQRVGYRRVSTVDQNTDRQLDGAELDKVFTDKASGKDANRPELARALEYVRDGDTLVVHSMDRLARNLEDLLRLVRELTGQGVKVEFVKENLTFAGDDSAMSTLLLSMLGAVAAFERSMILERQREGIALAKAAGKYKGRKAALTDEQADALRVRLAAGESVTALAKELGVSRQTVYNYAA